MSFNDDLDILVFLVLVAACVLYLFADNRKRSKIIKKGLSGKNSYVIEAMPNQLTDARRNFEKYQWKLVGSAPHIKGAKLYRFVRAVGTAPDAYDLHQAWRSDKRSWQPTAKGDFQIKIMCVELRDVDDTKVP